jgi:hypothetical protein
MCVCTSTMYKRFLARLPQLLINSSPRFFILTASKRDKWHITGLKQQEVQLDMLIADEFNLCKNRREIHQPVSTENAPILSGSSTSVPLV